MHKQVHLYYGGRVQGVGFRFTAREIADELGVSGWVSNLHDGRVEIVAEAEEVLLKDFILRLHKSFADVVRDELVEWLPMTGAFRSFTIKR